MDIPPLPPLPATLGLPMAFTLGLVYGMGPCLLTCLPYLGPVFLNSDGGVRRSWRIMLPLALGRLSGYAGLGLACGLAAQSVDGLIANGSVRVLLGSAALLIGFALLLRAPRCPAPTQGIASAPLLRRQGSPRPLLPGGLYMMGLAMALTPCAPLGAVLATAAALADTGAGLLLGLVFGLGAVLVPTLAYGIGAAYFGRRLSEQLGPWRGRIQWLSATLLLFTGTSHLAGALP